MGAGKTTPKQRQRAPSQRALENRARILDAAEQVFARDGFDGATIRRIAELAGVPLGLVNHHMGSKEALFQTVVGRRAEELSTARLDALDTLEREDGVTLDRLLGAFFRPYLDRAGADAKWRAYARLVAQVSADPTWHHLSETYFDPTARRFIAGIAHLYPGVRTADVSEAFVYSVSAMLAYQTSHWRIGALAGDTGATGTAEALIAFCAAGINARLSAALPPAGS